MIGSSSVAWPELSAQDRCDACGAQARVTATKGSASLLLCRHHANEHELRLTAEGWLTVSDPNESGPQ